jgi:hydroxymethylpyrimidine/phosphomethylpyrimidine kinase
LVELLLPGADLLTPNLPEAELLVGMKIESEEDRLTAMRGLLSMGARAVLLKGGHMDGESAVDRLLTSDGRERVFAAPRVETRHTHGTGCTLSAAVAAGLGQGMELEAAVARAKDYLTLGLRAAYPLGKGCGPPHHLALKLREKMRGEILEGLAEAGERIIGLPNMKALIPEVRMNIGAALPFAETSEDVAAFAGRITCTSDGRVVVPGCPAFGASSHIARVILAAGRVVPDISCAANLRYSEEILSTLERNGLAVAWFDREEEPAEVKAREGGTLEWGTLAALSSHDAPERVRAVCDKGEVGKEPMIRLLAGSLAELMRDMDSLARAL